MKAKVTYWQSPIPTSFYILYLNKNQSFIPVLSQGNTLAYRDSEKADMLVPAVSTRRYHPYPSGSFSVYMHGADSCNIPEDYLCSVDEIYHSCQLWTPAR